MHMYFLFLNYNVHYNPESVILQRKVWRKSQKTLSLSKNEQISLILFVLTAHTRNVFRTLSNMQDGGFCENSLRRLAVDYSRKSSMLDV